MISREEMQEIAKRYKNPIILILGSHSALDMASGARNYGLRRIIYTTKARAEIYLENLVVGGPKQEVEDLPSIAKKEVLVRFDPRDFSKNGEWRHGILILDRYDEIMKYIDDLIELEALQVPNRAFSVYVGGEACKRIENEFKVPIVGSRMLLKIENREEVEKNYYWFLEKAGIPYPEEFKYYVSENGIRFEKEVEKPLVFKVPFASRRYERGFVFAANSKELEKRVIEEVKLGHIDKKDLPLGRVEEYIPGVTANFNFFYSPIYALSDWGEVSKYVPTWKLANELLSIDERRETTHDGVIRMIAEDQLKVDWSKTNYPLTFEVTAHSSISLRESLLRFIHAIANRLIEFTREEEPPGIIGPYTIQTLITYQRNPQERFKDLTIGLGCELIEGVYDVPAGGEYYDFIPVTQDLALRLGGGTNAHMGVGAQYSNIKYNRRMSVGDRIALEIRNALKRNLLHELVT